MPWPSGPLSWPRMPNEWAVEKGDSGGWEHSERDLVEDRGGGGASFVQRRALVVS